ncbi:MAG: DUF1345 domain-containing protein [Vulcanimicrobiaceae bacterium]
MAALVGLAVSVFGQPWLHGATRIAAAYDAGTITLLMFLWRGGLHADPQLTRARAALDDPGRNGILILVLMAVVVGLVAAVVVIGRGPQIKDPADRWEAYLCGIAAVALGWLVVHTTYTFRYAHLYWYDDDGDGTACGGITFPGTPEPSDYDFAYFAFCIGASFAVSDPQVTETRVRREIITHSIISFAYNSVIIGLVINLFAGIFSTSSAGP